MGSTFPLVINGYGGTSAYSENVRASHYGGAEYVRRLAERGELAPGAVYVDLTVLPRDDERLWNLSLHGPMADPTVPDGMVCRILGDLVPFDPRPQVGRPEGCAFLGNAHGLDRVSVALYCDLARKAGARVVSAASLLPGCSLHGDGTARYCARCQAEGLGEGVPRD